MTTLNKAKDDYMFAQQFHWFTGVIEDVNDPEQRGRYRVRCFGYHTEKKDYIPTTTLPWAHVMMPITSAAQSGVGESATGLLRGTWVVGFFRDGPTAQDPLIMGSIPSQTPKVDYKYGFCDPTEQYPYKDKIKDQDIPEEAISKDDVYKESFSYKKKEEHRDLTPVKIAMGGDWELPPVESIVKVEYPKNHVKAWERKVPIKQVDEDVQDTTGIFNKELDGRVEFFDKTEGEEPDKEMHVQEFDVTPGWERVSTMHKSGTYHEWTPAGDETVVIVGNEYRIIVNNQQINIKGDYTLTVEGNYHRKVLGNEFIEITGNKVETVYGNKVQTTMMNAMETITMNKMTTTGMNAIKTVGMNKFESTALLKGAFTGIGKMSFNAGVNNEVNMGIKAENTAGLKYESTIGGKRFFSIGPHLQENWTIQQNLTLLDYDQSTWGNHNLAAGGQLKIGSGVSTKVGSVGPVDIEGVGVTINSRFPVCIPPAG